MKKLFYFLVSIVLLVGLQLSCTQEELPGGVYGTVVDKESGEPIRSVGVELSPLGQKTVTGSDGQFEFVDVEAGTYNLFVTKTDYKEESISFEVKPGQKTKVDIQIVKLPPALKVLDDDRNEIKSLDFGASEDDVIRSFSLFNDGPYELEWQLAFSANWIKSVSKTEGVLASGTVQSLLVTIDRALLSSGQNKTTIHITSNSGNNQLTVTATNGFQPTTLNTFPATEVRSSSATLHGEIITDGTPKYTERGFVYSESSMPTIDNCIKKLSTPLTGTKSFSTSVTNLVEGKTYYVRAYAINDNKDAYSSNEISFVATGNALAKVTTKPINDINRKEGKALLLGEITDAGDPVYNERGFVYSKGHEPSIVSGVKIQASGNGIGEFSANVTQLEVGCVYYVRAYAINTVGVAYGEEQILDMNPLAPSVVTDDVSTISIDNLGATFNATITYAGDPTYIERGFVYAKTQNPTINRATKIIVSGTTEGTYSKRVTGLDANCTYYVRAYATYSKGTVYGEEKTFIIKKISLPTVSTSLVTDITYTSAMVEGCVTHDGTGTVTERGICYSTTPSPTTADYIVSSGSGKGNYTVSLTNLSAGTTYYVRAYAINEKGVGYGEQKSFKTYAYGKPLITTISATGIDYTSATVGGNVTLDGGNTVTERGVCYSTATSNPTTADYTKTSGGGLGSFTVELTGLASGSTYYVRAYAINAEGISYGEVVNFTTKVLTYEAVDLGLSVKWATFNVGATKPEEYGDYFAWGETAPKDEYTWPNYKHCYGSATSLIKYCSYSSFGRVDNKEILESEDDAAQMNWGANWRMPTLDELEELKENCGWAVVTINGVRCQKATSYINGNSIIFPLAGCKDGETLRQATYNGYYWGSKSYGNSAASALTLWTDVYNNSTDAVGYKGLGFSVRPVCP